MCERYKRWRGEAELLLGQSPCMPPPSSICTQRRRYGHHHLHPSSVCTYAPSPSPTSHPHPPSSVCQCIYAPSPSSHPICTITSPSALTSLHVPCIVDSIIGRGNVCSLSRIRFLNKRVVRISTFEILPPVRFTTLTCQKGNFILFYSMFSTILLQMRSSNWPTSMSSTRSAVTEAALVTCDGNKPSIDC